MENDFKNDAILIIDFAAAHRQQLVSALTASGMFSLSAGNSGEAEQAIQDKSFSVVVVNLVTPDHSELDLLQKVKEKSPTAELIVLTSVPATEPPLQSLDLDIFAFIQKPFSLPGFVALVARALKKSSDTRALSDAEMRYRQLYDGAIDGVVTVDLDGHILDFNPAFLKTLSFTADELKAMTFWDFTPEWWWDSEKQSVDQIKKRGYSDLYEKEYRDKDGHLVPVEISGYLSVDADGKPAGMWAFVRDITDRKASEHFMQRQLLQMTALHEIASAGTKVSSIDELIEQTTQNLGRTLYTNNFGVLVFSSDKRELKSHESYHGLDEETIKLSAPLEKGITGRCAATGQPQRVADTLIDPDYWEVLSKTRSELCVPIWVNGEIFGVINSESDQPGFYSEEDEKMFITLANQLAAGVERIQSLETSQQRARELAALYDTAIAMGSVLDEKSLYERIYRQVIGLFPLDGFLLALVEPQAEGLELVFIQDQHNENSTWQGKQLSFDEGGLIGWVIQKQRPLFFNNLQNENLPVPASHIETTAHAWLGVPLVVRGHVIGGISVQSYRTGQFSVAHSQLLESMAALVAVALDNARLLEQTRQQLERLTALHDIDLVINSSLDLRVTLNILLDQVVEKLGVDASAVLLLNQKNRMLEYASGRGFRSRSIEQYRLRMGDGLSGQAAMERHLVQALNLDELDEGMAYTSLMEEEGFVSYFSVPLIAKGQVKGVLDIFNRSALNPNQDWVNFLETLAGQTAIAIDNTSLLEDLHKSNMELTLAYDTTLEGWSRALDLRDHETEGHTRRVVDMTVRIAQELGLSDEEIIPIRRGALLHDIGKMGTPDNILNKPGPLTDEEWQVMRQHPVLAHELLYPILHLRPALDIPYCHHERWDGSGYPRGLKDEEIPLAARIFSVVDVWDALTSDRPYRKAWSAKKALDYIKGQRGSYFDPAIVDIFLSLIKNKLIIP